MKVVVNTGPLVFLSKINRLSVLQKFDKICIPKGVLTEIKYKKDNAKQQKGTGTLPVDARCLKSKLI